MAIIKLSNAGDAVTWRIKSAETVAGKFGSQVKFENDKGDLLYISEETAGRQLGRIPLDVANCAGETLTFWRSENPKGGAPFWNIKVADAVDRAAPVQSKRLPPPGSKPIKGLDDFPDEAYGESVADPYPSAPPPSDADAPDWVTEKPVRTAGVAPDAAKKLAYITSYLDILGYVRANAKLTDEVAIQAATATIWIGLKQEGLR
jgi:hypothetical protein